MQKQKKADQLKNLFNEELIGSLLNQLYSKQAPSKTLNDITFNRLIELEAVYEVEHKPFWIGSIIADLFIAEARKAKDLKIHLPLAVEFANKYIKENKLEQIEAEKILEIITTHHGGQQNHLESKLFKIADCHKFLEPAGLIDLISDYYKQEGQSLTQALTLAESKLNEKYSLIQELKHLDKGFDIDRNFATSSEFIKRALRISSSI
jgi:hypothetical protein